MSSTRTQVRVASGIVGGLATTLYYASPDYLDSPLARGLAKTTLVGAIAAAAWPEMQSELADSARPQGSEPQTADLPADSDEDTESRTAREALEQLSTPKKAKLAGMGAVVLAGVVAGPVWIERRIYRKGEERAANGVRLPHTKAAIVYGALAAGASFIPMPDERGE